MLFFTPYTPLATAPRNACDNVHRLLGLDNRPKHMQGSDLAQEGRGPRKGGGGGGGRM